MHICRLSSTRCTSTSPGSTWSRQTTSLQCAGIHSTRTRLMKPSSSLSLPIRMNRYIEFEYYFISFYFIIVIIEIIGTWCCFVIFLSETFYSIFDVSIRVKYNSELHRYDIFRGLHICYFEAFCPLIFFLVYTIVQFIQ